MTAPLPIISCPQCGTDYSHGNAHHCPTCNYPCHEDP